jgi:hypothetical protein
MAAKTTTLNYTLCQNNNCSGLTITDNSAFQTTADNFFNKVVSGSITVSGITDTTVIVTEDVMPYIDTLGTGAISIITGSTAATGVGTLFTTELSNDDLIIVDGDIYQVTVVSDVSLTLSEIATSTFSGIFYYYESEKIIDRSTIEYIITNTFTDGLYNILYTLTDDDGDTFYITKTVLLYCNVDCCVSKLLLEIPNIYQCNSCQKERIQYILEMEALRVSLENAVAMGKYDIAENILDLLTTICSTQNCTCND